MNITTEILIAVIGSGAIFGFIQFIIQRRDARWNALNDIKDTVEDVKEDIADVKSDLADTKDELEYQINTQHEILRESLEERQAVGARIRILTASDEIRHDVKHSKEWFDQINEDITVYENYCETHPGFRNNKASHAITNINHVYEKLLLTNDFLK